MVGESVGTDALARAILDRLEQEALLSEPEIVVKSKLALARIRAVRYELLAAFLLAPNTMLAKRLRGLARYEREAFARQRRVIRKGMKL
ncbi:hypothetical protein ACVII1_002988 [Bradyrhizobium elkanii]|uniref:hypothetical protein n=1 Tax=Bradyrhizobium TaxID=374 RepID=UPI0005714BA9|nr:hypothetical protein [Bradyrhizobium elkanii]WLA43096.1 hypothetical protein QNJ95_17325 [Bradyrhizobium elkanii]